MLGQPCSFDHGAFPKKYFGTCAMRRGGRICPDVDRYFPQWLPYCDRCIPWSVQVVGDGCLDDPITPVYTDRSQRCWRAGRQFLNNRNDRVIGCIECQCEMPFVLRLPNGPRSFGNQRLGHIQYYEVNRNQYIQVVNFKKHQSPHHTEKESGIPGPNDISHGELTVKLPYPMVWLAHLHHVEGSWPMIFGSEVA
jgi:hypothetical protein